MRLLDFAAGFAYPDGDRITVEIATQAIAMEVEQYVPLLGYQRYVNAMQETLDAGRLPEDIKDGYDLIAHMLVLVYPDTPVRMMPNSLFLEERVQGLG